MSKSRFPKNRVFFLNPRTCGIYKNGGVRYKVDEHGHRSREVDNELLEHVETYLAGLSAEGTASIPSANAMKRVLVPRYFDARWDAPFNALMQEKDFDAVTIGSLLDDGVLTVRGGHGSPGNDQRIGSVPYVKVSDIRNLRININPTNLVPLSLARRFWRSSTGDSGLRAWDVVTPNRASSNIGEFALILPGEEQVVLTKEVFVFRVVGGASDGWSPFYLLWALCLKAVRMQWQRVTLMQTNREDVGDRYREIRLPKPKSKSWADEVSEPFSMYFRTIAMSKQKFLAAVRASDFAYIASVFSDVPVEPDEQDTTVEGNNATEGAGGESPNS